MIVELITELTNTNFRALIALIIADYFLLSTMASWFGECCVFFRCHKKSQRRNESNESVVVEQDSAVAVKKGYSNPIVRANDVINFVVPSVEQRARFIEHQQHQQQHANDQRYEEWEMFSPNNVQLSRSSSTLNTADFNLKLYSPGQETNDEIHTEKSKIGFSFQYDHQKQELLIKVLGALSLPSRIKRSPPNPYVKVTILPEKLVKYTTKTLQADNNPLFNESFVFDVSTLNFDQSQLHLKVRDRYDLSRYVYHESRILRSSVTLGQTIIIFVDLQLTAGHNLPGCRRKVIWCLLQPKLKEKITSIEISKGEINLRLCYEPEHNQMILEVIQVRNVAFRNQEKHRMLVKLLFFEKGFLKATRRTQAVKCEASSSFKEKFIFTTQTRSIHESSCQVILIIKTKIGSIIKL